MDYAEIIINENYSEMNPVQFGHADCDPKWSFGPAIRDHWLLHFVVSGKGIFEREGVRYNVKPGEIFVIPPHIETYYEADSENPWNYIWIGFTAGIELPPAFSQPIIRFSPAQNIFKSMLRCSSMENGKVAYLNAKLWELFALLRESSEKEPDYIEKALSLIHSEYMNSITVLSISERLGLDRSYFSTLFHKKVGVSPAQYLIDYKLKKAAEFMTVYGETPSTASASTGYTDIYHFSKAFKNKFGCSPREYIKKYRNSDK